MEKIYLGIIVAAVFIFIGASVFVYYTEKETQTAMSQAENLLNSSLEKGKLEKSKKLLSLIFLDPCEYKLWGHTRPFVMSWG